MSKKWKALSSDKAHVNDFWTYFIDKFEMPNGNTGEYHYISTNGSSLVVPFTKDGSVILVNQYRYLNKKDSIEFPCGGIEDGLSPSENAQKELREETGYSAEYLKYIGEFSPYTGVSTEICSVFIAKELIEKPLQSDNTEDCERILISPDEIDRMICDGEIWDGMSIAAWVIAKNFIKKNGFDYEA